MLTSQYTKSAQERNYGFLLQQQRFKNYMLLFMHQLYHVRSSPSLLILFVLAQQERCDTDDQ